MQMVDLPSTKQDMTGRRFSRLVVEYPVEVRIYSEQRVVVWRCVCDCGSVKSVTETNLRSGHTKSCGCYLKNHHPRFKHGNAKVGKITPEYRTWSNIKKRCMSPKASGWEHYGERGIRVCQKWVDSFDAFLADVGSRPSPKHTIDRINPNGNYEPGNVRWATWSEQQNNRRNNVFIDVDGDRRTVSQWARVLGIKPQVIEHRIKQGWLADLVYRPGER